MWLLTYHNFLLWKEKEPPSQPNPNNDLTKHSLKKCTTVSKVVLVSFLDEGAWWTRGKSWVQTRNRGEKKKELTDQGTGETKQQQVTWCFLYLFESTSHPSKKNPKSGLPLWQFLFCVRSLWAVLQVYWELDSWEVGCPWGSCVPMWHGKFSTWDSSLCRAVSEHWLTLTAQHCEWMGSCVHLLHQSIRVLFHVPLLMESWWNLIKESRCIRIFFLTFLGQFLSNYTLLKAIDFSCLPRYNLFHINVVYLPQLKYHIQVWTNKLLMNGMLKTTPSYWRQFIFPAP